MSSNEVKCDSSMNACTEARQHAKVRFLDVIDFWDLLPKSSHPVLHGACPEKSGQAGGQACALPHKEAGREEAKASDLQPGMSHMRKSVICLLFSLYPLPSALLLSLPPPPPSFPDFRKRKPIVKRNGPISQRCSGNGLLRLQYTQDMSLKLRNMRIRLMTLSDISDQIFQKKRLFHKL